MSDLSTQVHLGTGGTARCDAAAANTNYGHIAPDCAGMNFYEADPSFRASLLVNMDPKTLAHFEPILKRLGDVAGNEVDQLARIVDQNPPKLEQRDRFGRDIARLVYHPAYLEMEKIGFEDFQLHSMTHQQDAFGYGAPAPQMAKYAFQYLFIQSEFGMMCPLSITDATIHIIKTFGSPELKEYLMPKFMAPKMKDLWKGTQWMTERAGGSDVGTLETTAKFEDGKWLLYGDKWFSSHTDAHVALILARPAGAPAGIKGVAMFALPRYLKDGSRNNYRIVRIKDKMGTKSLATCEIVLEGAEAYLVGKADQGIKQMMEQVNMSRLSHGVRAAGQMRRSYNEAMQVATHRHAFGKTIIDHPLLRRQVMKILVPAEQALALSMLGASQMDKHRAGDEFAGKVIRMLTPLVKFRACRDAINAARAAMETRGGNGYIEEWVNSRVLRDSLIGVLWEGTSNINAIDVVRRAVSKAGAHEALQELLLKRLEETPVPESYRARLRTSLQKAYAFICATSAGGEAQEHMFRTASTAYYNACSAVVLAWEGLQNNGEPRKLVISRFVLEHKLEALDPLNPPNGAWETGAYAALLDGKRRVTAEEALAIIGR